MILALILFAVTYVLMLRLQQYQMCIRDRGYTAAEIGRMMGAPSNTVLSWLRRARAQLHTMLKDCLLYTSIPADRGKAEQGIMEAKSADTFKPEGWTPKFNVIETWNKAFPKACLLYTSRCV